MYLRCPECKTRYEISAARIPDGGARVRCPRCQTVFQVSRPLNGNGTTPPPARAIQPGAPVDADTARRIARSLIGDLATQRHQALDEARRDGRVLSTLGNELLEVWDDYRKKVGDEHALDGRIFRETVNELLGLGEPLL
jgi:predicted Zn finger-like uncharacterized protein